jgi:hypothetical protein
MHRVSQSLIKFINAEARPTAIRSAALGLLSQLSTLTEIMGPKAVYVGAVHSPCSSKFIVSILGRDADGQPITRDEKLIEQAKERNNLRIIELSLTGILGLAFESSGKKLELARLAHDLWATLVEINIDKLLGCKKDSATKRFLSNLELDCVRIASGEIECDLGRLVRKHTKFAKRLSLAK